jgi:hypothetical protein
MYTITLKVNKENTMAGDGVRSNKKPFKRKPHGPDAKKSGPKPKYDITFPQIAKDACGLKATDKTLAVIFDVTPSTIAHWKKKHPEFGAACRQGKLQACVDITGAMQKAAEGYFYGETTTNGQGEVTTMRKYAKPCPTASKLLLAQRMPEDFGDTSTRNTIYANNLLVGGDVNESATIDANSLTADQLRAMLGEPIDELEVLTIEMETGEDDE